MEMAGYKSQICLAYRTGIIQHNPTCLYNTVETGITAVQHKHTRLLRLHGKRQIFPFNLPPLQKKKKELFVTIVTCMIPTGHLIPPLLLFPEKNMKLEMMNGTPLASLYICHPLEWI